MPASTAHDLVERVSYLSSTKGKDGYIDAKTPSGEEDIEGGALRAGGRPNLYSKDYIGLLVQYAGVGIVYGSLPATVYPVMQEYLNMEGTQILSANVLLVLPWSFKVFYGILSDCFPIFGYRRRPFMLLGWIVCFIMLLIMACSKIGKPYYLVRSLHDKKPSTYTAEDWTHINKDAPNRGGNLVVLMMFAAIGYVGSDVAADAVVVELAQREPANIRGTTQTTIYIVRTVFMMLAVCLTGFLFNGEDYGGTFDFSLSFPQLMWILVATLVPVMPCAWFFIKEEKHPGVNIKNYLNEFWELLQSRAMYQVIAYKFFSGILETMVVTASSPIASYWAKVTPINNTISSVLSNGIFAAVLYSTMKWGLQWNWRSMHVITQVGVIGIDMIAVFITTWDVFRSQWFWLGPPLVEQLPYGVGWMISSFVVVELAGEGNEGAVYGLLTTVTNLSSSFSGTISKNIDNNFRVSSDDIAEDSHDVRKDVTTVYLITYALQFCGLIFLPLLPRQKKETQELKAKGGKSAIIGALTIFYLLFALAWSVMINIMSIYPSTSCYKFVGGNGC